MRVTDGADMLVSVRVAGEDDTTQGGPAVVSWYQSYSGYRDIDVVNIGDVSGTVEVEATN